MGASRFRVGLVEMVAVKMGSEGKGGNGTGDAEFPFKDPARKETGIVEC